MLKLIKFLKPFIFPVLIAVAFLYIQAQTDLALPDYMSDIVNKGIQQGGIIHAVPEVVKESDMDKIILFMDAGEQNQVMAAYKLISVTDSTYSDYQTKYPMVNEENTYILVEKGKDVLKSLDPIMGKALLSFSGVKQMMTSANGTEIKIGENVLPEGTDMFEVLAQIPMEQRLQMMSVHTEQLVQLGDNMIVQAGANIVKTYYGELGADTEKIQSNYIMQIGFIMVLVSLLGAACSIAVGFIAAKVAAALSMNLRRDLFTKVQSFSNQEFDKFSTASLITRSTNDITQIQMLMVMMIRMVFYAPIMGVGGVIRALERSTQMSWVIALAVLVLLGLILIVFVIAMPKFKAVQKLIDKINLIMRENLSGMMVIRAFNTQNFEEERFDKGNGELTATTLFVSRVMAFMMPMMMLIMNGVTLLIIWVGAHQVAESRMQVGDMMAFMQYAMLIIMSFLMLSMMFIMLPRATVAAQRIGEVLDTKLIIKDPGNPEHFDAGIKAAVEFKNVSFKYPGAEENMLKNVSFRAEAGETTAFIGATGSGKTTLVNLIPRFYDVTDGAVCVCGKDVRLVTQHELREQIGYIPQKASLFSGTIESNLKYANESATLKDLNQAASIAQAADIIAEKSDGYQAAISQGGANVSGGQKQRLSIARALVKRPKIYIFDDSFSALDFKTDAALRHALQEQTGDSTILIVAQRISTIKNADQIIVLDDGKMVGRGTHNELMESCEAYQEIAMSQLSKEELA